MKINNRDGFAGIDAAIMIIFIVASTVITISLCNWIMADLAYSVDSLAKGTYDIEILQQPTVQNTYNWCTTILMSLMGLGIIGLGLCHYIGAFSHEYSAKAKEVGVRLLFAICITPFLGTILSKVVEFNQLLCVGFLNMSGMSIRDQWLHYYCISLTGGATMLMPMFAMMIVGLGLSVYMLLLFRLVFMMLTYSIAPIAVLLLAFPHLREWGEKFLKIFFESVFCLLFFDMGFIFSFVLFDFAAARGLSNPLRIGFAMAGLAMPLAIYKVLWNPISKALGSAIGGGIGTITGLAGGGLKMGGAAPGVAGAAVGGGRGGGGGGAGGIGSGGSSGPDRLARAGATIAQSDRGGMGTAAGIGIASAAFAYKGGKKAFLAGKQRVGEHREDTGKLSEMTGISQRSGPFAQTRMRMEAKRAGSLSEFDSARTSVKADRIAARAEAKKDKAFTNAFNEGKIPFASRAEYSQMKGGGAELKEIEERLGTTGLGTAKRDRLLGINQEMEGLDAMRSTPEYKRQGLTESEMERNGAVNTELAQMREMKMSGAYDGLSKDQKTEFNKHFSALQNEGGIYSAKQNAFRAHNSPTEEKYAALDRERKELTHEQTKYSTTTQQADRDRRGELQRQQKIMTPESEKQIEILRNKATKIDKKAHRQIWNILKDRYDEHEYGGEL